MSKIIVGASSGIGSAIAKHWLAEGENFTAYSRENKNNLPNWKYLDVMQFDAGEKSDLAIDTLVYAPGTIVLKPIHLLKLDDFIKDMEINFFGAVRTVQHFLPNLKKSDNASILFFSTVAVQTGMAYHASIASAKGAIEGFTRSLAAELAPKIRVNCIALSLTDTPLATRLTDTEAKLSASMERHPVKRIGAADDVASLALWLTSEKSNFVTGQIIKMDGGISSIKNI